jgi:hypothetical protein
MPFRPGTATLPRLLAAVTVVHVFAFAVLFLFSFGPAGPQPLNVYTSTAGVAFLLSMSAAESVLACLVARRFGRGEPLYRAWLIIVIAAQCRFAGLLLVHVGARSHPSAERIGFLIAGPLHLLIMGAGLFVVYRLYSKLGFGVRLRTSDFLALGGIGLYVVFSSIVFLVLARADGKPLDIVSSLGWINDPLLCIVLLEALLLRRMVMQMGGGLVERCWTSYSVAILLTAVGDLAVWVTGYPLDRSPVALSWLAWYLAAAAYALGPTWQLAAIRYAEERSDSAVSGSLQLK